MYRKEVNERSPMRVFEESIHGGLGRGKVGVLVARAGVGKTALLVQIALDDLLRNRKVLHISHLNAVDHVRSFYDEIFHDLVITHHLAQPQQVHLEIERNRTGTMASPIEKPSDATLIARPRDRSKIRAMEICESCPISPWPVRRKAKITANNQTTCHVMAMANAAADAASTTPAASRCSGARSITRPRNTNAAALASVAPAYSDPNAAWLRSNPVRTASLNSAMNQVWPTPEPSDSRKPTRSRRRYL